MALLSQWVRQRPWLTTGLVEAAGSISGFAHYIATGIGAIGVSKARSRQDQSTTNTHLDIVFYAHLNLSQVYVTVNYKVR